MKRILIATVGSILALSCTSYAESKFPMSVEKEDYPKLKLQSSLIVKQITPLVKDVTKSVVRIVKRKHAYSDELQILSNGTVTSKGILAKWSEVEPFMSTAIIVNAKGETIYPKLIGVYEDYDLALFSDDLGLEAISFENIAEPELGDFLVLSSLAGKPAGFGAVSVLERSLREEDKGFLGIRMEARVDGKKGVFVREVTKDSAAEQAGIKAGDKLISVDGKDLGSMRQTITVVQNLKPGQKITVGVDRGGKNIELNAVLGAKDQKRKVPARRMRLMENMGKPISQIRNHFPSCIQSDMMVDAFQMGGPVVDLDGKFVGVTLSRSRIKTYIIPAKDLRDLLENAPEKVTQQQNK